MLSRYLSSGWSRFFAHYAPRERAGRLSPAQQPPRPKTLPIRSRQELEVAWLLRFLPFELQLALWADLLTLLWRGQPIDNLPREEYTWPGIPGVTRPRYLAGVLGMKTQAGLDRRLEEELRLSVCVLCAPEGLLARPLRNALLAMEGARLAQVYTALGRYLSSETVQALFRQKLTVLFGRWPKS